MSKNCKSCKDLKNRGIDVDCSFEIGDKECASLGDDKGFNGKKNDCQDMHDLNDCLLGRADSALDIHDDCDWKGYLKKLVSTLYNLQKMTICAICGIWKKIHWIEEQIEKIWKKIAKMEDDIDNIASQNWEINTRYGIQESTKGMSVSINRGNGDFIFRWKDWGDAEQTQYLGEGEIRGTVNFGMRPSSNASFDWQVRDVVIQNLSYKTNNIRSVPFTLHLYLTRAGEQEIYTKSHDTTKSFNDNINKTLKLNNNGNVGISSSSGWLQFLEFFNDGPVADDRANLQIEFKNNGKPKPPRYI
ncbi:hypothetical protein [Enterococcus faecalis]|uniref:hypothetical protein n=1 Tax=Enterococcus faecalis TaxID=1351 RepID=UPI001CF0CA00|nr:hypothetical protein [Enterococcus faecalis]UNT39192.1 hypothetical protein MPM64_09810 [Enterococcus faecalis]